MHCSHCCSGGKSHFCRIRRLRFFHFLFVFAAVAATNTGSEVDVGIFEKENLIEPCIDRGIGNSSNGCNTDNNTSLADVVPEPTKRIVGGEDAPRNRYPYFVSLQEVYNGTHKCGGSLVAPDVVVTAAHCQTNIKYAQVGKYYLSESANNDADVETFEVMGPLHAHPLYNSGVSFSYDVLLFKLNRKSSKQYVRINTDPNLPSESSGGAMGQQDARKSNYKDVARNEHNKYGHNLTVMGIGSTKNAKFGTTAPTVLQETTTSFVPNRVCRRSKAPDLDDNYQNLISDDMMCAFEDSQDACQGDSGGPLIFKGNSASNDILVGIVSWGFGCAHPSFPGVYSRVSYYSDWVIATICELSSEPPLEYDCANVMAPSQENSVPITVIIQFDDHPGEISWSIGLVESDTILVNVTEEIDTVPRFRSQETVFLPPGTNLIFTIRDRYGDGLCCTTPGNFRVVLGRNAVGIVLAFGGGDFGREESHSFQIPEDFVEEEEKPLLEDGQIPLIVVIQLDRYPNEIGWRIDKLGIEVEGVIRIPAGIYTTPEMTVIRTIILEKDELYYFNIYDIMEDGMGTGYVQLFLGTLDISDTSRIIFESDGNFQSGIDHTFSAAFPSPTLLPPSNNYMYLTLVMNMDLYPGEISLQLRMDNGQEEDKSDSIIFFRPPNYYKDRVNEIVSERISIPLLAPESTRQFSFIIADSSGDGMCCLWNGELDTGYTLYEGDPSNDRVVIDSNFESLSREVRTFSVDGLGIDEVNLNEFEREEAVIKIRVTLTLDVYPDETGFFIANSSGKKLFYIPPGTFTEPNGVAEKFLDLNAGLYTFNMIDTFGDGINREGITYRIDIIGDNDRPSILTGTGNFLTTNSQAFLLEGEQARYPLQINMKTGPKPEDFAFTIYRLDHVEAVAPIASKSKGEYNLIYDDISESLFVTKGGLYEIVFENAYFGVHDIIQINLGPFDDGMAKAVQYTFDTSDTGNAQWWKVKIHADEPTLATANDGKMLTLRILSYCFSDGLEWILLLNRDPSISELNDSEVIGYGPLARSNETDYIDVHDGKRMISRPIGYQTFTIIITADDNFEKCPAEDFSLKLYDGQTSDESPVYFDRSETGRRIVLNFSLTASGSAIFYSPMWSVFKLTSTITLLAIFAV